MLWGAFQKCKFVTASGAAPQPSTCQALQAGSVPKVAREHTWGAQHDQDGTAKALSEGLRPGLTQGGSRHPETGNSSSRSHHVQNE